MQDDKIKLYEELLAADPGSRLFLPLARLYLERWETDKAISTLQSGLTRYQEHFEARLLLHDILSQQGRTEEAREHLRMVSEVLRKYPVFWKHWADTMEAEEQVDASVATRFLGRYFEDRAPSWAEILRCGTLEAGARTEAKSDEEAAFGSNCEQTGSEWKTSSAGADAMDEERDPYRTKTMADILASQGDYAQALDIYTELQAKAESSANREKMQQRIDWVKQQLDATSVDMEEQEPEEPSAGVEPEMIHRLERLAERLEARG